MDGPPRTTFQAAWGELDGASPAEVAIANTALPVEVLRWRGGGLRVVWTAPTAESSQSVAWADADGAGDADLFVGNCPGADRLYGNEGGALKLRWSTPDEACTKDLVPFDLDGDGDVDLAAGGEGPIRLYLNDGALKPGPRLPQPGEADDLAAADVDGDGDIDLLAAISGEPAGGDRLYRNDGGLFTLAWTSPDPGASSSIDLADVNGDGRLDLAVARPNDADQFWFGVEGGFERGPDVLPEGHTREVRFVELDDAPPELVIGREGAVLIVAWDGGWSAIHATRDEDFTEAVATGDADGDGRPELLVGNRHGERDPTPEDPTGGPLRLYRLDPK